VKVLFYSMLPDFGMSIAFWKVLRFPPFILLETATCKLKWLRSSGGMMTGQNRNAPRKIRPSDIFSTVSPTWPDLGSKTSPSQWQVGD